MDLENKHKKMYQDLETYTFTVNPCDKLQFFNKVDRFRKAHRSMGSFLAPITYAEYTMYPEISKKGRIHWHGYITITDAVSFQLYDVPRLTDKIIYEIDELTDPEVWERYITKDKKQIKSYCKHLTFPYGLTNKIKPTPIHILKALQKNPILD